MRKICTVDAHTRDRLRVRWFDEAPIRKNSEIGLPEFEYTTTSKLHQTTQFQFRIERIQPNYCDGTYRYAITEKSYRTGILRNPLGSPTHFLKKNDYWESHCFYKKTRRGIFSRFFCPHNQFRLVGNPHYCLLLIFHENL